MIVKNECIIDNDNLLLALLTKSLSTIKRMLVFLG